MPMYQQLEQQLEALIKDGTLAAGSVLPAERQLAESMGLSRTTVQRAYAGLRERKLLLAQGRRGFQVENVGPLSPGMDRLKGFTEEMRLLGKTASSRILERRVTTDRSVASIFGLPSPSRLLKLVRVRCGNDIPLSREVAWYNVGAAPELERGELSGSVYAFLADCGRPLLYCDQTVEATTPSPEECKIFGFSRPIPCLLIKRCSYTHDDVMMEYVEGLFRGDAYSYRLRLTI
jgi:GntR family transcriptional regulator